MPRTARQPATKARRKPAAHLLVLECQTSKLHRECMAFGTSLHTNIRSSYPEKTITLAATDTREELTDRLGAIKALQERYRIIMIVAHSNPRGLQLTNDDFCAWTVLASWLKEFSPEHLFLVACDAGQLTGICALFGALPSLRKVYASPVPINPDQAQHLRILIEQLIYARRVEETTLRLTQALSFLTSRGVLFQWKRADCQRHNRLRGIAQTIGAQFVK